MKMSLLIFLYVWFGWVEKFKFRAFLNFLFEWIFLQRGLAVAGLPAQGRAGLLLGPSHTRRSIYCIPFNNKIDRPTKHSFPLTMLTNRGGFVD